MPQASLSEDQILATWPVASYFELFELSRRFINPVAHRSYRLRQRLVESVRGVELEDKTSRIELAMGNLKFLDQGSQKSWWDFIRNDLYLVDLATRRGLHTGYMLPETTGNYMEQWLEAGGGMHRAAQMMWDRCFLLGKTHHLKAVLSPRYFNAEHHNQWKDRVVDAWGNACEEAKKGVFDYMSALATSPGSLASDEYASRKKWTMAWLETLADDAPSTRRAIEKWLEGAICRSGVDPQIEGLLRSRLCRDALHAATPTPGASRGPRL